MLCVIEIAMTVFGIITLTKGKISFSKRKVVSGGPAYLIGLMLMATFPLTLGIGIVYGVIRAANGQTDMPLGAALIDVGVVGVIGITSGIIAAMTGKAPAAIAQPAVAPEEPLRPPPDPKNPYAP